MSASRQRRASLAALLLASCVHRTPPPLTATHVDVQETRLGVRAFVHATVAGERLRLLLDTGAQSVLPAEFAKKHQLTKGHDASGARIIDANARVTYMPLLPDVPLRFDDQALAGTMDFLMNPAPGQQEAILAPQDLVRPGWAVVIDLAHGELRYEREEEAVMRLRATDPSLREEPFTRCLLNPGPFDRGHRIASVGRDRHLRIVSAKVNGVPAEMIVDTGAASTTLTRNNPAVPSMLGASGDTGSITGATSIGRSIRMPGVPVVFAGTAHTFPVTVVPVSLPCGQGFLGADVLRSCTMVWGWSALWVACR